MALSHSLTGIRPERLVFTVVSFLVGFVARYSSVKPCCPLENPRDIKLGPVPATSRLSWAPVRHGSATALPAVRPSLWNARCANRFANYLRFGKIFLRVTFEGIAVFAVFEVVYPVAIDA